MGWVGRGGDTGGGGGGSLHHGTKKKKNRAALSLTAFAGAKSSKYNKAATTEKKKNLNAKKVNKYRKWLAQEGLSQAKANRDLGESGEDAAEEGADEAAKERRVRGPKGGEQPKRKSALHKLHEQIQAKKKAAEEERERKRLEIEETNKQKKAAEEKRQAKRDLMRKKTRKGQPVMKHRINSLLEKIQVDTGR